MPCRVKKTLTGDKATDKRQNVSSRERLDPNLIPAISETSMAHPKELRLVVVPFYYR